MHVVEERAGELSYLVASRHSGQARAPILIGLHGRGAGPDGLLPTCEQLGDDYVHVLPRAPLSHGEGFAWYRPGDARNDQLGSARQALLLLLAQVRARFGVGPEKVGVWGFSQGGVLSLELALSVGSALAAAVCIGGRLDPGTRADEERMRQARGRDFFLVHGVGDQVVPHTAALEAYVALGSHGARVELAELPMEHEITAVCAGAVRGYFASVLSKTTVVPIA